MTASGQVYGWAMENDALQHDFTFPSAGDSLFRECDIYEREIHRFNRAFEAVGSPQNRHILDIGAYPGTAFKVFGKGNRCTSFGITTNEHFLALLTRENIPHIDANIETYREPVEADIILFMEIIEHLRRPYAALKNLWAIAKPGTRVYVTTNNTSYYGYILKLTFGRDIYDSIATEDSVYPCHTRYYGLTELATEMERIGFHIESRRHINLLPPVRFYRNRAFGLIKNAIGLCTPARYASHIEIVARR